jgi:hypothetical protein
MRRYTAIAALLGLAILWLFLIPVGISADPAAQATVFPPGVVTIVLVTPTPLTTTTPPGGCYEPLPFGAGDEIGIRGGVNIRNLPTASGGVVGYFQLPVAAFVVEGPVCADGYNWWKVRGVGIPGWVAEGRPGSYFLNLITDASNPEPCTEPQSIAVGERVRLLNGVRVRETPGEAGLVLTVAPYQSLLPVVGGPVCDGGLNYWQIEITYGTSGTLIRGWIAEGPDYDYYIEPENRPIYAGAECFAPMRFDIGERIVVRSRGGAVRNLRSAPSERSPLVATLVGGLQLTVLAGPVCRDRFNWWQVQVYGGSDDPVGWVAEGTPQNRFLDSLPISDRPT